MQYFYVQHRTLLPSPVLATTGCCFRFGSAFIPSGAISPLFSSSTLGTSRPGELTFQCRVFLPFLTVHHMPVAAVQLRLTLPSHGPQPTRLLHPWDFQARVLEWGDIAFSNNIA